jgi:acyl carrier protein
MDKPKILEEITNIMRDYFDNDDLVLTMQTTAADVKGWDSLNHVNIAVAIEQRFGIRFATAEMEEMHNVGDLVNLIAAKAK